MVQDDEPRSAGEAEQKKKKKKKKEEAEAPVPSDSDPPERTRRASFKEPLSDSQEPKGRESGQRPRRKKASFAENDPPGKPQSPEQTTNILSDDTLRSLPTTEGGRSKRGPRGLTQRDFSFFEHRFPDAVEDIDNVVAEYKGVKGCSDTQTRREGELLLYGEYMDEISELQGKDKLHLLRIFREEQRRRKAAAEDIPLVHKNIEKLKEEVPLMQKEQEEKEVRARERQLELQLAFLEHDREALQVRQDIVALKRVYNDAAVAFRRHVEGLSTDWEVYRDDRGIEEEETEAHREKRLLELDQHKQRLEERLKEVEEETTKYIEDTAQQEKRYKRQLEEIKRLCVALGLPPEVPAKRAAVSGVSEVFNLNPSTKSSGSDSGTYTTSEGSWKSSSHCSTCGETLSLITESTTASTISESGYTDSMSDSVPRDLAQRHHHHHHPHRHHHHHHLEQPQQIEEPTRTSKPKKESVSLRAFNSMYRLIKGLKAIPNSASPLQSSRSGAELRDSWDPHMPTHHEDPERGFLFPGV